MSDLDRQIAALIGRMEATLQQVDRLLEGYKPKLESDRRELEWARENIRRRLAEAEELFPSEANGNTDG